MEGKQPFYTSVLRTWWIFFFLRQIPLDSQFWQVMVGILPLFPFNATFAGEKGDVFFWIRYILKIILKKQSSSLFWFRLRLQSQKDQFLFLSFTAV